MTGRLSVATERLVGAVARRTGRMSLSETTLSQVAALGSSSTVTAPASHPDTTAAEVSGQFSGAVMPGVTHPLRHRVQPRRLLVAVADGGRAGQWRAGPR